MTRHVGRLAAAGVTLAGFLLVAACARSAAAGANGLPAGRTFLSTSVTDGGRPRPLAAGTTISVGFQPGTVTVSAGCNTISGPVRLDGDRLVAASLASTEIGCETALADQDAWLAGFLTSGPQLTVDGPHLTLRGAAVVINLTDRKVVDPDRALAGTHWVVDTIIAAGTASSVPADLTADLTLSTDGTVTGNTGCRGFSGTYTAAAAAITFGPVAPGKRACPAATVDLDRAVLAALTGTVTYSVDAGGLTLTGASGAGLGLTAR